MEIVGEHSRHSLQENLHLIKSPVQVIWGKEDQVFTNYGDGHLKKTKFERKMSYRNIQYV